MAKSKTQQNAGDDFDTFTQQPVFGSGGNSDLNIGALNLDDVPDNIQVEVLPAGIYNGVIENVEFGPSQRSGNPMLTWTIRITHEGREFVRFYHTVLVDNGLVRLKKMLNNLKDHAPGDLNMAEFRPEDAASVFIGTPCRARLRVQQYEGQPRNSVTDVLPPAAAEDTFA